MRYWEKYDYKFSMENVLKHFEHFSLLTHGSPAHFGEFMSLETIIHAMSL